MKPKIDWRSLCKKANSYFVTVEAYGLDSEGNKKWTYVGHDQHPTYPLITEMANVYGGETYCTSGWAFPGNYPRTRFPRLIDRSSIFSTIPLAICITLLT